MTTDLLMSLIQDLKDPSREPSELAETAETISRLEGDIPKQALLDAIAETNDQERRAYIAAGASEAQPALVTPALLVLAAGPPDMPQLIAAKILRDMDDPAAESLIIDHILTQPPLPDGSLAGVVEHLTSRMDEAPVRAKVLEWAQDVDAFEGVRTRAINVLGEVDTPDFESDLIALLADPSEEVRMHASMALENAGGPDAVAALAKLADPSESNDELREVFIASLLSLEGTPACGWKPFLKDPNEEIQEMARDALGMD